MPNKWGKMNRVLKFSYYENFPFFLHISLSRFEPLGCGCEQWVLERFTKMNNQSQGFIQWQWRWLLQFLPQNETLRSCNVVAALSLFKSYAVMEAGHLYLPLFSLILHRSSVFISPIFCFFRGRGTLPSQNEIPRSSKGFCKMDSLLLPLLLPLWDASHFQWQVRFSL